MYLHACREIGHNDAGVGILDPLLLHLVLLALAQPLAVRSQEGLRANLRGDP